MDWLFGSKPKEVGPWTGQQGYLKDIYSNASSLYDQAISGGGAGRMGQVGNQMGQIGHDMMGSYNNAMNYASNQNLEQDLASRANNLYNSTAYQGVKDQITQGMNQNLASSAVGANARGMAGSSRAALMDANIVGNAQNSMTDLYSQASNQVNQNAMNQANMNMNLGSQGMNYYTQALNYTPDNYRWNQLGNMQSSIGSPIMGGQQQGQQGQLGNIIGAIGKFSDEELKTEIVPTGPIAGIPFYTWKWNDTASKIGLIGGGFGVIAQEIQEIYPDVVSKNIENGFLQVDYHLLTYKISERLEHEK